MSKRDAGYLLYVMLNWISLISKMFDFLRRFFSTFDNRSRKRRLVDIDSKTTSDFLSPIKRHCGTQIEMPNGKDVIEIEDDDDDDVISCDDSVCKLNQLTYRQNSPYISKHCSGYSCNSHVDYQQTRINSTRHNNIKMGNTSCKSQLNAISINANTPRHSTLSKTYQLREKEQYSKMLQNFLLQPVQILNPQLKFRKGSSKPIETIDVEDYESTKSPETYTPKTKPPLRWHTPMTRFTMKTMPIRENSIEVISVDDNDDNSLNRTQLGSPKAKKDSVNHTEESVARSVSQIVPTNTVRDQLSTKDVLKKDYIPRVAERYNERFEQRFKEAEELKKMTRVLAKHNRLSREAALEKRLAHSMRLCEAVLEEADYFDEPKLPEITPLMMKQVKNALIPRPPDQVLSQSFGLRITRKDIYTLADLNWLNDEVINFYMNLLISRGGKDNYPSVYAMNTFFYPKLLSGGHASLKRWTRKVDIFAQDIVVVPIHLGMHWCMSIIDFRDKSIRYYDSMGGDNQKCLIALRQYLEDESRDKKKERYDTSDWTLENMSDIPQQMNGSDCGVFSCTFAEYICANKKLAFSQDDMPYFRNKMVYEILNVKLL